MARQRQKTELYPVLFEYFRSKGGILSKTEFNRATDAPIRAATIRTIFKTYERMITLLVQKYPQLPSIAAKDAMDKAKADADAKAKAAAAAAKAKAKVKANEEDS